jgi:ankyrin repeat protein
MYPLHLAIASENLFAIKMLLRKHADITVKNNDGKTPADCNTGKNRASISKLIQSSNEFNQDWYVTRYSKEDRKLTTVDDTFGLPYSLINDFVSLAHFNLEKTKEWLNRIPDLLLARASWDELAIEGCSHIGIEPVVKYLLDKGAPFSVCTAMMLGESATVKDLLQKDKRILNDRGPHDFPLIWYTAIGKPKPELAELLLKDGADVNANIRGRFILSECALRGHAELAEFLCSKGADVNMRSVSSFMPGTPLEIAKRRNNTKVADVLIKYGAK